MGKIKKGNSWESSFSAHTSNLLLSFSRVAVYCCCSDSISSFFSIDLNAFRLTEMLAQQTRLDCFFFATFLEAMRTGAFLVCSSFSFRYLHAFGHLNAARKASFFTIGNPLMLSLLLAPRPFPLCWTLCKFSLFKRKNRESLFFCCQAPAAAARVIEESEQEIGRDFFLSQHVVISRRLLLSRVCYHTRSL